MKEIVLKIRPYWPVLGCVMILCSITLIAAAFNQDATVVLPKKLYGEWRTPTGKYANRFFILENRLITIGTAKDDFEVFIITGVKINETHRGDSYTLTYSDDKGIRYDFTFHYFPHEADGGAIRIKNRNETVWMKKIASNENNA